MAHYNKKANGFCQNRFDRRAPKGKKGNFPMRTPTPRSRKSSSGAASAIPAGFTIGRNLSGNTGWRCPTIQQDLRTQEWRRCSKHMQKRDCAAHLRSGRHQFDIPRANDPGFPADFDARRTKVSLQQGFDEIHRAIARFTARSNLSVREASGPPLMDFVREVCEVAIRLRGSSSRFQASSIPRHRTNNG